jgi:hypothetical protein
MLGLKKMKSQNQKEIDAHEICARIFEKQFHLIELEIAKEESLIYCPNIEKEIRETKDWIESQVKNIRNSEEWIQEIAEEYGVLL